MYLRKPVPPLDYLITYSIFEEHTVFVLTCPVLPSPSDTHKTRRLIHNSLSKVGRDVPVLDKNKVSLPYPQFSLEVRRITFTSGLDIVE